MIFDRINRMDRIYWRGGLAVAEIYVGFGRLGARPSHGRNHFVLETDISKPVGLASL